MKKKKSFVSNWCENLLINDDTIIFRRRRRVSQWSDDERGESPEMIHRNLAGNEPGSDG